MILRYERKEIYCQLNCWIAAATVVLLRELPRTLFKRSGYHHTPQWQGSNFLMSASADHFSVDVQD